MKVQNIGGYSTINAFVDAKLNQYNNSRRDFAALFEIMFSERENIMYEQSRGYRVVKTTYGQAYDSILKKSATLRRMLSPIESNSVIGIYMDNSLAWIEMFWTVLCSGYRPLLMNLRLDEGTLEYALGAVNAAAVISDEKIFSRRTVLSGEIVESDSALRPDCFGSEIMVMSSGTSSHVKICAYSAEEFYYQIQGSYSIIKQCRQIKRHYDGELKLLTFLPFYHIFGLVAVYIWFAFFSRTFVQLNDMSPQTILNTIKRHKVTHVFAVPLFWEKVYEQALVTIRERGEKTYHKFEKGMKLSRKIGDVPLIGNAFTKLAFREVREGMFGESIQFMITGGSYISSSVMELFNAIGYRLADGYGMTEIGITSVELSPSKTLLNSCSVGKPMAGVEYKINEKGELLVRGRAMARYIIEDGEKRGNSDWFNTHDLASCTDGRYRILGRQDDLIIAPNGENLNPNLIEPKLAIGGIRGLCLLGAGNEEKKTPVLLVSVNKYITSERLGKIEDEIRARLGGLKLSGQVAKIVFTSDSLLKDDEFKLNRARLSEQLGEGTLTEVNPDKANEGRENDKISREITKLFAISLGKPENEIGYTSDFFFDEGGSSLDYFAVVAQLREEFHVPFPSGDTGLHSVKGLHDYIKEKIDNAD